MAADNRRTSDVAHALEKLHRAVMSKQFPRLAGKMHGLELTFSQLVAISVVSAEGSRTITQIARSVDLSHNASSRMVARLVEAGLFSRVEDPTDRRQKRVELTEKGAAFMPEVRAASLEAYDELLSRVPDELARRLLGILGEVEPYLPAPPNTVSRVPRI